MNRCPFCEKEGKKSSLPIPGSTTTDIYCPPYFDEEGEYHNHDENWNTAIWECSLGHRFMRRTRSSCPAGDFGGEDDITLLHKPDVAAT